MGFVHADLSAVPIDQLAPRRMHLGPFGSGRDLVKFLGVATVGAAVAAVSSVVLWLPFLGLGVLVSFVRVEGRTLDDYAWGYLRFRWRTSAPPGESSGGACAQAPTSNPSLASAPTIRAGGIPVAYLPPSDLQRLFEEWRSTLTGIGRPVSFRVRGERFSLLPFLPRPSSASESERRAHEAYRKFVRLLLRHRYRRIVEITVGLGPSDYGPRTEHTRSLKDGLLSALTRMGVPAEESAPATDGGG